MRKKFIMRGGDGKSQRKAAGGSISVIARFSYTLSAIVGQGGMFWDVFWDGLSAYSRQCVREQANT